MDYFKKKTNQTLDLLTSLEDETGSIFEKHICRDLRILLDNALEREELIGRTRAQLEQHEVDLARVRAERDEYRLLFDMVRDGLWYFYVPADGRIEEETPFFWSQTFRTLLGFTDEASFPNLLGSWSDRIHPEDRERVMAAFTNTVMDRTGKTFYDMNYRLKMRTGEYRWFSASGRVSSGRDKAQVVGGSLRDIHDEKMAKMAVEGMVPVVITDKYFHVSSLNDAILERSGYSFEEIVHANIFNFFEDTNADKTKQFKSNLQTDGMAVKEFALKTKTGELQPVLLHVKAVEDEGQPSLYIFTSIDISNHKAELARLKYDSEHDLLTGCFNRAVFESSLVRFSDFVRADPDRHAACLGIIDIDHFKRINDKHGHLRGDEALIHVSQLLQSMARSSDVVARVGGEEFAIILQHADLLQAERVFERIRMKVASSPLAASELGRSVEMTISIGVAPIDGDLDTKQVYRKADEALYEAKQRGRDRVCSVDDALIRQRLT